MLQNQNHQEIVETKHSCWTCRFSVGGTFFTNTSMDGLHCHGIARSILSLFFGRQLPPSQPEVRFCGIPTIPSRVRTFCQFIVMSGDTTHHHPQRFRNILFVVAQGFPGWSLMTLMTHRNWSEVVCTFNLQHQFRPQHSTSAS